MDVHITQGRTRFFAFGMFLFFLKIPCVLAVFHHMTFLQILQVDRRSLKITKCDQGTGSIICGEKKKYQTKKTPKNNNNPTTIIKAN